MSFQQQWKKKLTLLAYNKAIPVSQGSDKNVKKKRFRQEVKDTRILPGESILVSSTKTLSTRILPECHEQFFSDKNLNWSTKKNKNLERTSISDNEKYFLFRNLCYSIVISFIYIIIVFNQTKKKHSEKIISHCKRQVCCEDGCCFFASLTNSSVIVVSLAVSALIFSIAKSNRWVSLRCLHVSAFVK